MTRTKQAKRSHTAQPCGKLIVLDGIDGSGKATQTKLLKEALQKEGKKVKTIDFPRYYDNLIGELIGDCLAGERGDFIKADSRVASLLYAADRFESSDTIRSWLDKGYSVIADRYTTANQIHQGSKIENVKKRGEFLAWLDQMEYGVFGIPRPDLVIYLDVPFEISQQWLKQKINQKTKKYLKGKRDVAEDNLEHLKASRNTALQLVRTNENWKKVQCCKKNICMSPDEVHEKVMEVIEQELH